MGQIIQVNEKTLLADIERRLADEFPYVPPMVVDTLIRQEHARFEASRIRDFVPLLVEKRARRELKTQIERASAPSRAPGGTHQSETRTAPTELPSRPAPSSS
jgi:hypothetical protein